MNRRREESHLLPEYPLLMVRRPHTTTTRDDEDKLVTMAKEWAFASRAAREDQHEFVDGKLGFGLDLVRKEREDLSLLISDDGGDIWIDSDATLSSRRKKNNKGEGPWSRLNGRIGV